MRFHLSTGGKEFAAIFNPLHQASASSYYSPVQEAGVSLSGPSAGSLHENNAWSGAHSKVTPELVKPVVT
jgi:hypothetical protein